MKKYLICLSFIALAFAFMSCATTEETTTLIRSMTVSKEQVDMSIGSVYYIDYSLNFELKESESIGFESTDPEVAEVNMLGKVTGVGYGTCQINLTFDDLDTVSVQIDVSSNYEVTAPNKTIYEQGEDISTLGASLRIYDESNNLIEEVEVTEEMLLDFEPEDTGSQIVSFEYEGLVYGFEIFILNQKQQLSTFDDFIYLSEALVLGEKIEFALTKSNTDEFLEAIENVYDYNEINIYALIESPSGEIKRISAFWYQDYTERLTDITVNQNLKLEGKVFDTDRDYDVFLQYLKSGYPHYRIRFLPEEAGVYESTLVVEVDGDIIQTIEKSFTVVDALDDDFKGFIQVDESNKRSFIFDNGETYMAVGQNVAWYTSVERKYYDYKSWFPQMSDVGMNYARVWMAAWGYSPFWLDIYNYDQRQTNLYSLDRTIDIADEEDIYIQLCLLHHGMFSSEVNPMWPGAEDTWYTSRYGTNPYAEVIDNPGLFFASSDVKDIFKNQLKYIIARYAYSDNIMSFELFNEVDWIETYTSLTGRMWHKEMAEYIDSIDPNNHMITTSLCDQSFLASNYQVFLLDCIDYVNVHHYGIYNHVTYLPTRQNNAFEIFDKPVIYDEVGYQGWGGQDQIEADPNNVTLHQALWGGALGGGAGTAMNWWWESWIDPYDVYYEYQGIATYSSYMDLSGIDMQVVADTDQDYDLLEVSGLESGYIGYVFQNRAYLYIYDITYCLDNQDVPVRSGHTIAIPNIQNGSYTYSCFNTYTGETTSSETIEVSGNEITLTIPDYQRDIAIILEINQ